MKEKKCVGCGKTTTTLKDWYNCRSCGTHYCPECAVDHIAQEKEVQKMQKRRRVNAEKGDIEKRKRAICPQCDSVMAGFFSPDL